MRQNMGYVFLLLSQIVNKGVFGMDLLRASIF